jgi:hypothetical protein
MVAFCRYTPVYHILTGRKCPALAPFQRDQPHMDVLEQNHLSPAMDEEVGQFDKVEQNKMMIGFPRQKSEEYSVVHSFQNNVSIRLRRSLVKKG